MRNASGLSNSRFAHSLLLMDCETHQTFWGCACGLLLESYLELITHMGSTRSVAENFKHSAKLLTAHMRFWCNQFPVKPTSTCCRNCRTSGQGGKRGRLWEGGCKSEKRESSVGKPGCATRKTGWLMGFNCLVVCQNESCVGDNCIWTIVKKNC